MNNALCTDLVRISHDVTLISLKMRTRAIVRLLQKVGTTLKCWRVAGKKKNTVVAPD